jgi:iron complex outermembrane recepter protein
MRMTVAVAVACLIGGAGIADEATASIRKLTSIPAQNLGAALQALARERDVQVVYFSRSIDVLDTQGAVGELTTDEAFARILAGTGLTYRYLDDKTITILPVGDRVPAQAVQAQASSEQESRKSFWQRLHLAQTDIDKSTVTATETGSTEESTELTEIVVTAQLRKQSIYDVPMAITSLRGAQLQDRGIDTLQELSFAVPELRVHQVLPGQNTLALRGIGAAGGSMPLVGVYLDDIAASGPGPRALDVRTMDLERVEVLHGPQGTLYGQGSAAGTVRFITKSPSFGAAQFTSALDASFTQDGSPSQRFIGVANLPVVDQKFGLRVAGTYENTGGWIDLPAAGRKDINDADLFNVRVKGLWNVTPAVSLAGTVIVHRNDVGSQDGGEDSQGNAYRPPFASTLEQPTTNDYQLYGLTGNADLGGVELLSATSYYDNRLDSIYSTPFGANHRQFQERDRDKVFNQEIRLSSAGDGPLSWTVGAFYRDSKFAQDLLLVRQTNAAGVTTVQNLNTPAYDRSQSWSYFVNASYQLSERFEVGAGARYFDDRRVNPLVAGQRAKFHSFDPRVFLSYEIVDGLKAYASAAKGFRSGGFNSITAFRPQFEPDEVYSYEAGVKFSALQSRITGEMAAYYSEYEDMQLITPISGLALTYLGNVGKAEVKGLDWSLTVAVTDSTSLGTYGTVVDDEVVEIPAGSALRIGDPLNYVADYNYSLFAQQRFPWTSAVDGVFRVEYSEKGKAQFAARNLNLPDSVRVNESGVIGILYARLGASWERFSLDLYADNILNDRDRVAPNIVGFASRPRPRTFGVLATASF